MNQIAFEKFGIGEEWSWILATPIESQLANPSHQESLRHPSHRKLADAFEARAQGLCSFPSATHFNHVPSDGFKALSTYSLSKRVLLGNRQRIAECPPSFCFV